MDELRAHFEAVDGLQNVATFIASGNVVFDSKAEPSDRFERRIESHLRDALGYEVDTFLRSLADLETVIRLDLFAGAGEADWKVHVLFLKTAPGRPGETALRRLETEDDRFRVVGREAYWLRHGRTSDSGLMPADFERALGVETSTMRTMNTVERLVAKFGADAKRRGSPGTRRGSATDAIVRRRTG